MTRPTPKQAGKATGRRRLDGEVLDVASAALLLGATEKCIRSRVARQLLPYRRWGARVVFLHADLMNFLGQLEGISVAEAIANSARSGEQA